jgi:4'-phosphopantetheinyl transferase EntD
MSKADRPIFQAIEQLFEARVVASVASPAMYEAPMFPEEMASIAKAVPTRRREFAAGRACARAALQRLGVAAVPIPVGKRREPLWPQGYIGSISHYDGLCCAVAAHIDDAASIGVDVDSTEPMASELIHLVCTSEEIARLQTLPAPAASNWGKITFCAKEAVYKCYHPLANRFLGFHDVKLNIDSESTQGGRFEIQSTHAPEDLTGLQSVLGGHILHGMWRIYQGHILAGVTSVPTKMTRGNQLDLRLSLP